MTDGVRRFPRDEVSSIQTLCELCGQWVDCPIEDGLAVGWHEEDGMMILTTSDGRVLHACGSP